MVESLVRRVATAGPGLLARILAAAFAAASTCVFAAVPTITSHPASQTIFYGDPATFRVVASGSTPLRYQWFRDGAALSGATLSAYTISQVSSNDQARPCFVRVTNSWGVATSQVAVLTVDYGIQGPPQVVRLLSYTNAWRYNQTENLDGVNWTATNYVDASWPQGPGLLGFENSAAITPLVGTPLADPRIPPAGLESGHAYYFRTKIDVPSQLAGTLLTVTIRCDDGAVLYTNGVEARRLRMAQGTMTNASKTTGFPPGGSSDATTDEQFPDSLVLYPGTNVIAAEVHQANATSSDVVWGMTLEAVTYTRLRDTNAPVISEILPAPGSTVPSLTQIEAHFSEGVKGVKAADLLINGIPSTNVTPYAADVCVFDITPPATGPVQVQWRAGQGITDLSANSNRFAGGSYSYVVDPASVASSIRINEFMADNEGTIRDEDGIYSDWVELHNSGSQAVNLGRWYLTDDSARLTKWQIPVGVTLPARSYLLIWASGNDRTNPLAPLHTSFKLNKDPGSFLGLVYSDRSTVVSSYTAYPQQYDDVSYGCDRLDPLLRGYFTNATPGAANATLGPGFGPEVEFSVISRSFTEPFTLELTTADSSAVIRYLLVTNGASAAVTNIPNASSPAYPGPLTIRGSTQVRARAFPQQTGFLPGPLRNETYIQIGTDATGVSSDIPIVVFHDMGGGAVAASALQFMTMQVFYVRNGRSSLLNPPDISVQGYFHRRGQASFGFPKANLRVETQDAYGDNLDIELLGMPAEDDWVFYGINQFDKVLMHNPLPHELYRQMGHYSSHTRYVEVYLKDDAGTPGPVTRADYNGLYVLEEKIKISKERVDIDRLEPENTNAPSVTGGYLLSIDKSNPGSPAALAGASVWYLDPDYYEITSVARTAQKQYIDNYFAQFYSALHGASWTNPVTGYAAYIDIPSWIDHHLHNTFVFNVDMLRISSYFHKPRERRIVQGPLWDFDRAFADSNDGRGFNPRRWRSGVPDGGTDPFNAASIFNNPWYGRMFLDPDFWQRWIDRYQELRKTVYALTNVYATIDRFGNEVREATTREYARWTGSGGSDTSPRSGYMAADGFFHVFPTPGTWQGEIDFTRHWFSNRVDFMDSNFLAPPVLSSSGGPITPGFALTITAPTRVPNSTIYYTLDGTDPRLPGGSGVSPKARSAVNTANLVLTNNVRVFARNWNGAHQNLTGANNPPISSSWSGPTAATFVVTTPTLAITEIMYHPLAPGTDEAGLFEFIELKNTGDRTLNLAGVRLTNGIHFTFAATNGPATLAPGQYVVVVSDRTAFLSRYPNVTNIAGNFIGSLGLRGRWGSPSWISNTTTRGIRRRMAADFRS